jgi:hypothetical protein
MSGKSAIPKITCTSAAAAVAICCFMMSVQVCKADANQIDSDSSSSSLSSVSVVSNTLKDVNSKFLKIEKMRNKMFVPEGVGRRAGVHPAAEVALFKEQARRRMADRLTTLFDTTRKERMAREEAKRMVQEREVVHHKQFSGLYK